MIKNLGHWSQTGCLLALILLIGGEYKITHTCGRVSYCKVKAITLDGDYVIQHPKKIVGYNGSGHIPIIVWKKEEVTLSSLDIGEAQLLRSPKARESTDWNRLTRGWIPDSERGVK